MAYFSSSIPFLLTFFKGWVSNIPFCFTKMPLLMLFCHFVANLLVGKPNLWSKV